MATIPKMTQEHFRKKYIEKAVRITELRKQINDMKKVDRLEMTADFATAFDLPGWRIVRDVKRKVKAK
jgi:hypothetical protein